VLESLPKRCLARQLVGNGEGMSWDLEANVDGRRGEERDDRSRCEVDVYVDSRGEREGLGPLLHLTALMLRREREL
jgi:hypothetical protein